MMKKIDRPNYFCLAIGSVFFGYIANYYKIKPAYVVWCIDCMIERVVILTIKVWFSHSIC